MNVIRMNHEIGPSNADRGVWLVLPSACEQNCSKALPAWRELGYRIAVLQDSARFKVDADVILETDVYEGWPWAINLLCRHAVPESCRVMVAAGDDMLPEPGRRADEIAAEYLARFPDGFGVMQPAGDRFMGSDTYCGSPWFGRGWADRAFAGRGPIPTGYRHNWADMELYWVARGMGMLWTRDDLAQRHEHFSREREAPPPGYWVRSAAGHDRADCERFTERAWSGFPGCDPIGEPGRYSPEAFVRQYRSIAEIHMHRVNGRCPWDARRRAAEAMVLCQANGWRSVGVYGNGAHTDAVWDVLRGSPVRISAIVDDHAEAGCIRDDVPVVRPEAVERFKFDAVVISGNSIEDQLIERASRLGRPLIRLYGEVSPRVIEPGHSGRLASAR